ncbi:MAG: WYL domain-containing protein [Anaerolineales bacterium]|nr:WYL domain-containing protein [Anaerolineales bacterium]
MLTPTHYVFTLLNAFRHGIPASQIWREFQRIGTCLKPRLSFWLSLCIQAHLITETPAHVPTSLTKRWISWSSESQTIHLLEAWQTCPHNPKDRATRRRLLKRLASGLPMNTRERRELPGLESLGICANGGLTDWGRVALGLFPAPTPIPPLAWRVENHRLIVPLPADWALLWELERFLAPETPGNYPLNAANLREAVQRGPAEELIAILERGTASPLPPELRAAILNQPVLNMTEGTVLEFSNPEELKQLRRSAVLREHFNHILSSRHVLVDAGNEPRLIELLERRGIYARPLVESILEEDNPRPRAYFHQSPAPLPEEDVRPQIVLAEYLRLQQALDILYHAPGGVRPEPRRITPLLMEERGGQMYIIAYCHTRRAQRTFRLDRIEIPGRKDP